MNCKTLGMLYSGSLSLLEWFDGPCVGSMQVKWPGEYVKMVQLLQDPGQTGVLQTFESQHGCNT